MDPRELMRLVDTLHREKEIDSEVVFEGIEAALLSAARKHFGASEELVIQIDRETGEIVAQDGDETIDPTALGRIAAQTAKQVMIQKIREAECESISEDYTDRLMSIASGSVQRFEGPNIVVNLGRTEGFLPRSEQISGETYHVGERIRAIIIEVRAMGTKVRVVLSRAHPEFVQRLFELEVPEVAEGIIRVMGIAREPGHRTKVAVDSLDPKVDCVGACVGVQGSRIKSIVDELNGEKIDIVRWSDMLDSLIANTLKPAEIDSILLEEGKMHAIVLVPEDQLSLAIGKRGQNVRLASKLTGWDIDIQTRAEHEAALAGQPVPSRRESRTAPAEPTEVQGESPGPDEGVEAEPAPSAAADDAPETPTQGADAQPAPPTGADDAPGTPAQGTDAQTPDLPRPDASDAAPTPEEEE